MIILKIYLTKQEQRRKCALIRPLIGLISRMNYLKIKKFKKVKNQSRRFKGLR